MKPNVWVEKPGVGRLKLCGISCNLVSVISFSPFVQLKVEQKGPLNQVVWS